MANQPFKRIKVFPLTVAIWRNVPREEGKRPWYSITLQRSFKKADGEWENSESLNTDDLLLAAKLLDRAHTEVLKCQQADYEASKAAGGAGEAGEPDDVPF